MGAITGSCTIIRFWQAAITSKKPGGESISPVNTILGMSREVSGEAIESNERAEDLNEGQGEEIDAEVREEAKVKEVRDPGCPSQEERDRHNKTHVPFRPWLPI